MYSCWLPLMYAMAHVILLLAMVSRPCALFLAGGRVPHDPIGRECALTLKKNRLPRAAQALQLCASPCEGRPSVLAIVLVSCP